MALVVGDTHGRYARTKAFLAYKPEQRHIFVGDYCDAWFATDDDIILTMKLIFESELDTVILTGNHDNQYFNNSTRYMKCSGFRSGAYGFTHMLEMYKDRVKASHVEDDYIITHAGISVGIGKNFDNINDMSEWINKEFDDFKNSPVIQESHSSIFNIGKCRGGYHSFSGVFWADYRYEEYDERFNQIFGHSYTSNPVETQTQQFTQLVCVDCPQFFCFNTVTKQFEDFMPDEFKKTRDMLEIAF